jgi:putative membrane protein
MLSYLITISSPVETAATPMNFFLSGAVAIVAMILPGISGSFLLLIMGKYMQVIGAIKGVVSSAKLLLSSVFSSNGEQMNEAITQLMELGFGIVLPFACGCALGLGAFSWLLSYLLKHYRDMMMSILLGLMIGTLHKLWPIRVVTAYLHRPDKPDKVLQDQAVMPYLNDPMHLGAMVMIVVGLFFVLMVEKKAAK